MRRNNQEGRSSRQPRYLTLESGRLKTLGSSVLPTMILCSFPGPWLPPSARAALAPWRSPDTRSLVVFPMAAAPVEGNLQRGMTPGGEHPRGRVRGAPAPPLRPGRESPPQETAPGVPSLTGYADASLGEPAPGALAASQLGSRNPPHRSPLGMRSGLAWLHARRLFGVQGDQ